MAEIRSKIKLIYENNIKALDTYGYYQSVPKLSVVQTAESCMALLHT